MKAKFEQIMVSGNEASFLCYKVQVPVFEFLWHYHPEFELTYIVKGKGKRLVGDSYEIFEEGDMALLGPYLPHTWVGESTDQGPCIVIVIQFSEKFIKPLLHYPELNYLDALLSKAKSGLHFFNRSENDLITPLIIKMTDYTGVEAFTSLLQVLKMLSLAQTRYLASGHFKAFKGSENQQRINKVFLYVQNEYATGVSLKKAASIVHLLESAFCKFFKRVSGKTFSAYVNDVRIAKACELLVETDKPIEQIAFETGFESQTYFNRVFLKKKKIRPGEFRKHALINA